MAILRCNKCGHVAEVPGELTGQQIACPQCTQPVAVYDTVLFVRKVLQQYFSQRDELNALKAQQASAFPTLNESPAAAAGGSDLDVDIHNSDHLANAAQHAAVLQWFERRQIQIRANHDAVDTTGFFDEIAIELGDNYDQLREVVDKIRWGQQKDVPNFSLNLGKLSQKDGQTLNAFCKRLYDCAFLAKYFYQKQEKIGRGTIQSAPTIRSFFGGEWLEWYAFMKVLGLLRERRQSFSCARQLSVIFPNEDLHELDVFFLIDGSTPVCIECKTGEFRQDIDKYLRLRKRLGIDRSQFIICATGLTDEQAAGLSSTYELTFVTLNGLTTHLARLF